MLALAEVETDLGQRGPAAERLRKEATIIENAVGKDHPLMADCLAALAVAERDRPAEAARDFERGIAIHADRLGARHTEVAADLQAFARACIRNEQYPKAAALLEPPSPSARRPSAKSTRAWPRC